jgi:hypothetical protein
MLDASRPQTANLLRALRIRVTSREPLVFERCPIRQS